MKDRVEKKVVFVAEPKKAQIDGKEVAYTEFTIVDSRGKECKVKVANKELVELWLTEVCQ